MNGEAVLYESHSHTPLCNHAHGEPEEYGETAAARGLKGVIITCHNPMPDGYSAGMRMKPEQLPHYIDMVERAHNRLAGVADVRLGLECDYLPDAVPWLRDQTTSAPFDYILGSIHPHIPEYQALFYNGDPGAYQRLYFDHLAAAAETGLFDCLAHPDLIKNWMPEIWNPQSIMDHVGRCLDRIAATDVAMELNTSGVHKEIPEMNPTPLILTEAHHRGIPVVIGADAHTPDRVGAGYETALDLLEDIGFTEVSFFLERERMTVSIVEARRSVSEVQEG